MMLLRLEDVKCPVSEKPCMLLIRGTVCLQGPSVGLCPCIPLKGFSLILGNDCLG